MIVSVPWYENTSTKQSQGDLWRILASAASVVQLKWQIITALPPLSSALSLWLLDPDITRRTAVVPFFVASDR